MKCHMPIDGESLNIQTTVEILFALGILVITFLSIILLEIDRIGYPRFGMITGVIAFLLFTYLEGISRKKDEADPYITTMFLIAAMLLFGIGLIEYGVLNPASIYRRYLFVIVFLGLITIFVRYTAVELNDQNIVFQLIAKLQGKVIAGIRSTKTKILSYRR